MMMQFQADLLGVPLIRPVITELTARGAAFLAGLAVGVWKDIDQLKELDKIDRRFEPQLSPQQVKASRDRWREAVVRCQKWDNGSQPTA